MLTGELMKEDFNYLYPPLPELFQAQPLSIPSSPPLPHHPQPWGRPRGSLGREREQQVW